MRVKPFMAASAAVLMCASAAEAATVRVTVAEYSSKTGPYFEEAASAFEASNPDTDIVIEVVPWDVLLQKLTTDIAGNANADIAIIGTRWLVDFVEQGIVTPLDDYMTDEFRGRFIETFLTPSVMDEQTYGLPIAASARAMYYNVDLLNGAGVAEPPATWDQVAEAARKIADQDGEVYGYGLQGKEIETDVYYYYSLWSQGGDLLDEDGSSGLDSPEALAALELYKRLIDEGLTQPGVTAYNREDVQNLFKQGKVGMMVTAPFLSGQIAAEAPDLNYGVAPIPAGPDGDRGTYGVTDSIVLFDNSEVKDEAFAFLDFLFTREQRVKFNTNEGFLPVLKSVATDPVFADDRDLKVFAEILPTARFAPVIAGWEEIAEVTSTALQRVYLGEATPEAGLQDAAAEADAILGK
ncbi:ABC transporter substrate-binding protein [Marinivivus vitaminiproducens]|uniref:ABC transporter substrate-binding protein n=1 Tax=Marinivivus vitaminiproducens TaxID=3035935 RepID=UPI00279B6B24|nr:sugar ABC transporter substrate-binding protein [Geminicoccaceae bacterium SCSIO 64248]